MEKEWSIRWVIDRSWLDEILELVFWQKARNSPWCLSQLSLLTGCMIWLCLKVFFHFILTDSFASCCIQGWKFMRWDSSGIWSQQVIKKCIESRGSNDWENRVITRKQPDWYGNVKKLTFSNFMIWNHS